EQFTDHLPVLQILHDEPARRERMTVRAAGRDSALGNRDQALHERPKFFGARYGRGDVLVAEQSRRLISQERDAVLRDAAQFSIGDSMSHGVFTAGAAHRAGGAGGSKPTGSTPPPYPPHLPYLTLLPTPGY